MRVGLLLRNAFLALSARPTKTFMALLGFAVANAATVCVGTISNGLETSLHDAFSSLGANTIQVVAKDNRAQKIDNQHATITLLDIRSISLQLKGQANVVPQLNLNSTGIGVASTERESAPTTVIASTADYFNIAGIKTESGRAIVPPDNLNGRAVAFLGSSIAEELHLQVHGGERVKIGDSWFEIIGVGAKRGQIMGFDQDNYVIIPLNSARRIVRDLDDANVSVTIDPKPGSSGSTVDIVDQVLRRAHLLQAGHEPDFQIIESGHVLSVLGKIAQTVSLIVSSAVGVSLLVGGIGIMNYMLGSVAERTREIGIAKALGATRQMIISQFLIEALMICSTAALAGIFLGSTIGSLLLWLFAKLVVPPPLVICVVAFAFTLGIGFVFSIFPAAKAADLDCIDALRNE